MPKLPIRNRAGEVIAHVKVDAADLEWASRYRWSMHGDGYAFRGESRRSNGVITWRRTYLMHRELLGLKHGDPREVDHENGDGLDNRRSNLRLTNPSQNAENQQRKRSGTSSRFRGVCWNTKVGKWLAYAHPKSGFRNLGHYDSEEEAARVSADWRRDNMPFSPEARRGQ